MKQIDLNAVEAKRSATNTIVVGTRGSKLALWQTNWLIERLKAIRPGLKVETHIFTTQGDRIQDVPLQSVGNDGFFVRELEQALLSGEIDLAIHSLKDLPHQQPEGLVVAATPGRVDARDALLTRNNTKLEDLPQGAKIGTSSVRRVSQLLSFRPDFVLKDLRGNLDTRIRKLHEQDYDAIILATAGLERLGWDDNITERIPLDLMLPAPGQGALAPECRVDDEFVLGLLAEVNEIQYQAGVKAEREFMAALGGGCQAPLGAYAEVVESQLVLKAYVGSPEGTNVIKLTAQVEWDGTLNQAPGLAKQLADEAFARGAREILDDARSRGYVTERK